MERTLHNTFCDLHTRVDDAAHLLGRVHSLETCGTVDGPGTRFVVFLQGCLFRCLYCHNRDTWDIQAGNLYSVTDLLAEILPYIPFIDASHGGVTVTGGEPMLQREFVRVLFKVLHQQGVHTCLDTNGYVTDGMYDEDMDKLLAVTDLVLLDIKQIDEQKHEVLTGTTNKFTLKFARYLNAINKPVWIRHVIVPGYSDDLDDIKRLAEFIAPMRNVEKVELLPYHTLGVHKWEPYEESYPLDGIVTPPSEKINAIIDIFKQRGLDVIV